jgi:ubiquinol-cytochrome c reductase subunit 6
MVERTRYHNWSHLDAKNHSCPAEKYHFDECAARVAKAAENPEEHHGHPEDCAEEFLHLMHCVDHHIAEPLFRQLK